MFSGKANTKCRKAHTTAARRPPVFATSGGTSRSGAAAYGFVKHTSSHNFSPKKREKERLGEANMVNFINSRRPPHADDGNKTEFHIMTKMFSLCESGAEKWWAHGRLNVLKKRCQVISSLMSSLLRCQKNKKEHDIILCVRIQPTLDGGDLLNFHKLRWYHVLVFRNMLSPPTARKH